jgi:hypothetical protein
VAGPAGWNAGAVWAWIETGARAAMVDDLLGKIFLHLRLPKLRSEVAVFFAGLAFLASGMEPSRAASFTASLDRDTITLGETATLSLKFEGGSPEQLPSSMTVSNLQLVLVGGPSHFDININGNRNSYDTFSYVVTPTQAGQFTIPALTANVGGQTLNSQPLKLVVTKANAPSVVDVNSGNEVAFMRLVLPQKKIYAGQTFTGQLQIYLRDDVQDNSQPQFTSTPADGLAIGKSAGGGQSQARAGNHTYSVLPISFALTATKTGALTLGPFTANMVVILPSSDDQMDPFFRQQRQMMRQMGIQSSFIGGERKQVSLATEQVTIESLALPSENVPTNFNGVIGDFSMTVTAGPTNVTAGDPITVRVQISGRGAFDSVKLPDQSGWGDFKLFQPTAKFTPADQLELSGDKTFEEIVTPQNAGVHELPPFAFSFFNPEDGQYHTLTQPALPLVVKAAGATPMPTIAANKNSAPENQTPQDILPIKENLGTLVTKTSPLVAQPAFLAAQSVPVLAFLAAFIWRKRADNLANNPRLRRQRAVAQLVRDGLDDLKKHAAANQPDEFFALLFRLLQEQLGERLDCPASAITENVVEENPVLRRAPEATRADLRELFQLCNQARYAPVRGAGELNSVAAKLEQTLGELQEVKP